MTHTHHEIKSHVGWPRSGGHLLKLSILTGALLMTLNPTSSHAQDSSEVPERMAYVPFGPSIMGIDKEQKEAPAAGQTHSMYERRTKDMPWSKKAFHDEGPSHWVVLDGYFIDKYEVSNKDYAEFMKTKGHPGPAYWDDPRLNKPNQPVVGVNWFDAKAYCEFKGERLPTEAEWERAARGPEGFKYPWGNEFDSAKANYGKNHEATLPVDSMPDSASPYGLHHMAGNVFEWVEDWYDPSFYKKTPHPANTQGPLKPIWIGGTGTYVDRLTVGTKRVIRGGSWIAAEPSITTTHRFWNHPLNNSYGVGLGFRCAKTAPSAVNDKVRTATIDAMKSMGQEKWQEAKTHLTKALELDPHNIELKQMDAIVQGKIK